jgi:myo-inositol-1-phosphate synthase
LIKAKVAVVGVGNCASALIQGVDYYRGADPKEIVGLMGYDLGGLKPSDIEFVAAFDVNAKKVGRDLSEAIYAEPNNLPKICTVPSLGVTVQRGPTLDGIGKYLKEVIRISESEVVDVAQHLRDSGAEIVVNYLPVGSSEATKYYAEQALSAGCGFINAMPVFIASNDHWKARFEAKGLPIAGDDVMSQLGATVLHKTLVKLFVDRGVRIDDTYQLNLGGDTDFLNMLEEARLVDKRESKTSAVKAMAPYEIPTRIGPSDYVDFLSNDKICYVWLRGRYFGGSPITLDLKLHVVDAYNSAGIMVDAIRAMKIALNRRLAGPLVSVSAYCFKHPPVQMPYGEAKRAFLEFVEGQRNR